MEKGGHSLLCGEGSWQVRDWPRAKVESLAFQESGKEVWHPWWLLEKLVNLYLFLQGEAQVSWALRVGAAICLLCDCTVHRSSAENTLFLSKCEIWNYALLSFQWNVFEKSFFKRFYLLIFREWGKEGEREWEKYQHERETSICCFSHRSPTWDLACHPGFCPDQESNQRLFALWDDAQPTEPHWPGQLWEF